MKRPIDMLRLPSSPQFMFWRKKTPRPAQIMDENCKVFGTDLCELIKRSNSDGSSVYLINYFYI